MLDVEIFQPGINIVAGDLNIDETLRRINGRERKKKRREEEGKEARAIHPGRVE